MTAKTIRIMGEDFIEQPALRPAPGANVCNQCVFDKSAARCTEAIKRSPEVFGGDCLDRDVVYQPAPDKAA